MRLPNGYGGVNNLGGKRRNPWRARVTVGFDDNGKQIYKTIGYYKSRKDALEALAEYNTNPYDVDNKITFAELYKRFIRIKTEQLSQSSIEAYEYAYSKVSKLYDMKFIEIKSEALNDVMKNIEGHGTKRKVRTLFKQIFKFAMEVDVITKDYSEFIVVSRQTDKKKKIPFTNKEIEKLWESEADIEDIDTILIMIYTGVRIGELTKVEKTSVNRDNHTFVGGIKTDSGRDRLIPIHDKIWPLIEKRLDADNDSLYLIPGKQPGKELNYRTYRDRFDIIMEQLKMKLTPHECRHTFATLMANAGVDKQSITRIIGHASYVTTDKFYTHKDIETLTEAINKI